MGLATRSAEDDGKEAAMKRWIAGVIVLWLLVTRALVWVTKGDATEASQWGDAFGAVNALFSGLAFVVVLFTLRSQERQLKEQQEEIRKQNETLVRQQFEATFFQLMTARIRELEEIRIFAPKDMNIGELEEIVEEDHKGRYFSEAPMQ